MMKCLTMGPVVALSRGVQKVYCAAHSSDKKIGENNIWVQHSV